MRTLIAITALLTIPSLAAAADLRPGSGHSLEIGPFKGVLYYTQDEAGYRIVATMASGETPIRLVSTLLDGQQIILSVPAGIRGPAQTVLISRSASSLVVSDKPKAED